MRAARALLRFATLLISAAAARPAAAQEGAPSGAGTASGLPEAVSAALPCVVKLYGAAMHLEHGYAVGVIVSEDGLAVTSSGLLLDARNLRAVLHDGRKVEVSVVREDDARQLALLRLKARDLPALKPAASTALRPGDTVYALGNAYKIAEGDEAVSVTRGVFSLRTRLRAVRRKQPYPFHGEVLLYDAITSNPGMTGGPLLDADGRWVGLIGKVVVSERTNTCVSFALPSELVMEFLGLRPAAAEAAASQPGEGASAGRAYSGIRLFEMGLRTSAAYVDSVAAGSPAAQAGLRTDDLILAVDGAQVRSAGEFRRMIAQYKPGQRVTLAVKRGDKVLMLDLVLGAESREGG